MKRFNFSSVANKLNFFKSKTAKVVSALITICTPISYILTTADSGTNLIEKLANSSKYEDIYKPIFTKNTDSDTVNILVTKFDDYFKTAPNNCIGNVLAHRIRYLKLKKKIPINVQYADSIESPNESHEAKNILKRNNAQILIYGIYKNNTTICDSGSFCFKTTSYDLLKQATNTDNISIDKDDFTFRPFNSNELERGMLSLDSISFDNWIQSLYVLKKRDDLYKDYISLYSISQDRNNEDKINEYLKRADLNISISNIYDAVTDIDSAIFFLNEEKNLLSVTKYKSIRSFEHLMDYSSEAAAYIEKIEELTLMKHVYAIWIDNKFALSQIEKDITRLDTLLNKKSKTQDSIDTSQLEVVSKNEKTDSIDVKSIFSKFINESAPNFSVSSRETLLNLYAIKSFALSTNFENNEYQEEAEKSLILAKGATIPIYYLAGLLVYGRNNDNVNINSFYQEGLNSGLNKKELSDILCIAQSSINPSLKSTNNHKNSWIWIVSALLILILLFIFRKRLFKMRLYASIMALPLKRWRN